MIFSMFGQEKGDLLVQVTAWAGLTMQIQKFINVFVFTANLLFIKFYLF